MVLVSSDKAVRPTNVMGATKGWELIVQHMHRLRRIRVTQWFGSVTSCAQAVQWCLCLKSKYDLVVSDGHIKRRPVVSAASEAAELVIQAGAMAEEGGELFVWIWATVSIYDLAVKMIHLHGRNRRWRERHLH